MLHNDTAVKIKYVIGNECLVMDGSFWEINGAYLHSLQVLQHSVNVNHKPTPQAFSVTYRSTSLKAIRVDTSPVGKLSNNKHHELVLWSLIAPVVTSVCICHPNAPYLVSQCKL